MSRRLNHTPEYLINKTMQQNIINIFMYIMFLILFGVIFIGGFALINNVNSILSDILGVWAIVSAIFSTIILTALVVNNITCTITDNRSFSITQLCNDEKEYQKEKY